ncbi:helix-turn-helix domain-containing protein [Actinokineospora guangxiensis]|uniref:Helix-turn-helix domain-containing protein n=1 Tax=Actinokineospora guangxiensis TaxID=1490288 RepID=A0ABW0EX35_9PSEU
MSEPGDLLRTLREEKGLSINKLAVKANYNKGQISKIENGLRPLNADMARHLDRILETDGRLFRAVNPPEPVREEPPAPDDDEPWSLTFDGTGSVQMGSGPFAAANILPNSWMVDEVVDQFDIHFETLRATGHRASPAFVIPHLLLAFNQVKFLHRETAAPELTRIAYRIAEYTGWMCQEAGKLDMARTWTAMAVTLATKVGDVALRGYALVRDAEMSFYGGSPYKIITYAQRADADPGAPAAVRSLAAQREAEGHAILGDQTACMAALENAQRWHDEAVREAGQHFGTTSLADPIATSRGWSMLHFDPDESAGLLTKAIAGIPATSVRSRVRFGVRLARATFLRDDIDGACALLTDLLDDLRRTDSATVRFDLHSLADTFTRHRNAPAVRDLRPRLNALLHVQD